MRISGVALAVVSLAVSLGLTAGCRRKHVAPEQPAPQPVAAAPVEAPPEAAPTDPFPAAPTPSAPSASPSAPPSAPKLDYNATVDGGANTVNGHPDGPKADDMNKVLKAGLPKMESCLNASKEVEVGKAIAVEVKYKVGNDGKPTDIVVKGPVSATVQSCLSSQVGALPYPAFGGPPVEHSFPLNYQRDWKQQ